MEDDRSKQRPLADEQVEREIRRGRKFTPNEAMARLAGPGAMKGASPVSRVQQAETEIGTWLRNNVADAGGALKVVLHRHLKGSELLLESLDRPLVALETFCRRVLNADNQLKELVREADVEWGRAMGERPHFEREGYPPHPDDPYTIETVRKALGDALRLLSDGDG
jgi:hypothetical protein